MLFQVCSSAFELGQRSVFSGDGDGWIFYKFVTVLNAAGTNWELMMAFCGKCGIYHFLLRVICGGFIGGGLVRIRF